MTENEFTAAADAALARLEAALEGCDADIESELKDGGVLELEFADRTKMIINRHAAAQEIWVAAKAGGFHFRWDGAQWINPRDGSELFAALSRLASAQAGAEVDLT